MRLAHWRGVVTNYGTLILGYSVCVEGHLLWKAPSILPLRRFGVTIEVTLDRAPSAHASWASTTSPSVPKEQ